MSRVAILGASSKLGDKLTGRAVELGLRVNALSRAPEKIKRHIELVNVYRGDAAQGTGLDAALASCKNIIFAIASDQPVIAQCAANVVRQLQNSNMLPRFIFISCLRDEHGDPRHAEKHEGLFSKLLHAGHRRVHWDDLSEAASIVRVSGLSYVILRTTSLTDDATSKGPLVAAPHHEKALGKLARHDLAHFVLDLVSQPAWTDGELVVGSRSR